MYTYITQTIKTMNAKVLATLDGHDSLSIEDKYLIAIVHLVQDHGYIFTVKFLLTSLPFLH